MVLDEPAETELDFEETNKRLALEIKVLEDQKVFFIISKIWQIFFQANRLTELPSFVAETERERNQVAGFVTQMEEFSKTLEAQMEDMQKFVGAAKCQKCGGGVHFKGK